MKALQVLSKPKLGSLAFILVVSVVLGLPLLLHGPLVSGADTYEHLNLITRFSEQFWRGDLYPRWLIDMNHGLGSPTYFVFPPLPAYVCVLLQPLARVFHFNAFTLAAFLPLLGSGICAFLWLRTMASGRVAAVAATLYMMMPYHLAIDLYHRCAIPECWGFVWMPLILYFAQGGVAGGRRAAAGLAIMSALMIFSHLISLAMFFPVPVGLAMVQSPAGQRLGSGIRIVAAMALGAGVSAIYLFPALSNEPYISAARFVSTEFYRPGNHLLSFGMGLFALSASGLPRYLQIISWDAISVVLLAAVGGFVAFTVGPRDSRKTVLFWIIVCCSAVFMMSRLSSPIWLSFHKLHEAVEFPWRFSTQLCLGALPLLVIALSHSLRDWPLPKAITFSIVFLVSAIWLASYGRVWWRYKVDMPPPPQDERRPISDHDVLLRAWLPPGTDQWSSLIAATGPKVRFKEGNGYVQGLLWKPRQSEFKT